MSRPQPVVEPMIAARKAAAATKERAALDAIRALTKARQPVTFTAVAARAGVSRAYLSRHPALGTRIRDANTVRTPHLHQPERPSSVEAALRTHIRAMQSAHHEELSALRREVRRLEHENATLRGELISRVGVRPPGHEANDDTRPIRSK